MTKSKDPKGDTFAVNDVVTERFPDCTAWAIVIFDKDGAHFLGGGAGVPIPKDKLDAALEEFVRKAHENIEEVVTE